MKAGRGGDRTGQSKESEYDSLPTGSATDYAVQRLEADRPDLYARVQARGDDRPPLHASNAVDRVAWQRVYAVGRVGRP